MPNKSYHDQFSKETNLKIRELGKSLPAFCRYFFRGIEPTTQARTRLAYAYDLIVFFNYLKSETTLCEEKEIPDLTIQVLDKVTPGIIQDYLEYLKLYNNKDSEERTNSERGLNRKLASIRSFYRYFYEMEMISTNPASIVRMPKTHEKDIVRLEGSEISDLLEAVDSGANMTKQQRAYHEKTRIRDLAVITLLLGTGIRVSECVGLDLQDVDFKNHGIRITRKGGNQVIVYFGDEVEDALYNYLRERMSVIPQPGHEDAFFLSMQKKRLSVHSVENLVKKYASQVTQLKKITPHKLRSTYGTQLYRETGDIYLVADVLGHSDVNTTKKHYAALEDERRRSARNVVSLRKKDSDESD
ncbi:MAG: tyrosine-type recombinase/integrase [Parasporobacterium sp.]|nr:tyrosine-type recombinase/integrase [Parasporobacterium sp.]